MRTTFHKDSIDIGHWLLVGIFFILISCEDEPLPATISGKIATSGISNDQISIYVDGDLVATPSATGEFTVQTTFGEHKFSATTGAEDQQFSMHSEDVVLEEQNPNLQLGTIELSTPPVLKVSSQDFRSIAFIWSQSNAPGFREYKFYFGIDPANVETEANLQFLSTFADDTSATMGGGGALEPLVPGQTYYARVFVMDEFGKIAGSNQISVIHHDVSALPIFARLTRVPGFSAPWYQSALTSDGTDIWLGKNRYISDDNYEMVLNQYNYTTGEVKDTRRFNFYLDAVEFDNHGYMWAKQGHDNTSRVIKINMEGGAIVKQFAGDRDVRDLDIDKNGNLISVNVFGHVLTMQTTNGLITGEFDLPPDPLGWAGVTSTEGEIWALSYSGEVVVFGSDGTVIGLAKYDTEADCDPCDDHPSSLEFIDENHLVILKDSDCQIFKVNRQ